MKKYQICNVNRENKTAKVLEIIEAETIQDAVNAANEKYPRETVRIYPYVNMDTPETITEMARFTLASVENWERRNNYAVMNPINRSQWDKEDYTSIAAVAIIATLTDNPGATMYDVKSAAFSAIRAYQQKQDRNSEKEYTPGWVACNVQPRYPRATSPAPDPRIYPPHAPTPPPRCPRATGPALDRLITRAIDATAPTLSPAQVEVFTLSYQQEMSAADIAEKTGKARQNVYKNLAKAYYWVLTKAVELDTDGATFAAAGYTPDDIAETLATMRKRGGMNKNQK